MTKRKPYAVETKVPVTQSRSEIEAELTKYGATSFAYAIRPDDAVIMFEYGARRVRFRLPLVKDSNEAATAKRHRSLWRALFISIKAKLVSVDTGIETFEEAFLAHVVLADGATVGESVKPALIEQYKTGKMTPLLGYTPPR